MASLNSGRIPSTNSASVSSVGSEASDFSEAVPLAYTMPLGSSFRFGQSAKAAVPQVTFCPQKHTVSRLVQPSNADLPMELQLDGISTDSRAAQFRNAELPMLVTFPQM